METITKERLETLNLRNMEPFKKRKGLVVYIGNVTKTFRLYDTNILAYNEHFIQLNSGGWKTNHSKNCMNDNLPQGYKVYQKDYEWFVETPNGQVLEFNDEMVIERIDYESNEVE